MFSKICLLIFTVLTILITFLAPIIPQSTAYHHFVDTRMFFGVPNFFGVSSNIFFIIVGSLGLKQIYLSKPLERWPYFILFISVIFVSFGSSYYHLDPNNQTLFWDRLPIIIVAMAYFSAIFMERVNPKLGLYLLLPMMILGAGCVMQWEHSELIGLGDLRFYVWSQFYPIAMILLMLLLYPPKYTGGYYIFASLGWYAIAKICEIFDHGIYELTHQIISGHTLKHIIAAIGLYFIVLYLKHRHMLTTRV